LNLLEEKRNFDIFPRHCHFVPGRMDFQALPSRNDRSAPVTPRGRLENLRADNKLLLAWHSYSR
jgi:hypothetical protein